MHICFIVENYPYKNDPTMTFIRELVLSIANNGVKCTVIAPQSISREITHRLPIRPYYWKDNEKSINPIEIYQPWYFSFSNIGRAAVLKRLSKTIQTTVEKINSVDCFYAHFWHIGAVASMAGNCKPLFVACGESEIIVQKLFNSDVVEQLKNNIKGIVYVSTENINKARILGLHKDPYLVAPNGVDSNIFKFKNKFLCRDAIGWHVDDFVVGFVGGFIERKGVNRLSDAIKMVRKKYTIKSCFIGNGKLQPDCDGIIFCGKLEHNLIVNYLCACDIFVLPTINEGCCNAIIEAMACGLPIVSSELAFNDDILDETCSIRIDTNNVKQIAETIELLYRDSDLREKLSIGALKKAEQLTIDTRSDRIVRFIEKQIEKK